MTLTEIKYHDVQESFSMGGPYLGRLEFKGKLFADVYLADGERLSQDKTKLVFSKYSGETKQGLFGLRKRRCFHIVVYDDLQNEFYQSIDSFECLSIEKMNGTKITYHEAFHNSIDKFRRIMEFNQQNFERFEKT